MLAEILECHQCAEWMVAFGTILLAVVTFIIHLMGDSSTRLMKKRVNYEFKKEAYDFLRQTFSSAGTQDKTSPSNLVTVEERINKFYEDIFTKKIYLTYCNIRKFKKYVFIAKELAKAWDNYPNEDVNKYQRITLIELEKLSKTIGKESEIEELKRQYPDHFKTR